MTPNSQRLLPRLGRLLRGNQDDPTRWRAQMTANAVGTFLGGFLLAMFIGTVAAVARVASARLLSLVTLGLAALLSVLVFVIGNVDDPPPLGPRHVGNWTAKLFVASIVVFVSTVITLGLLVARIALFAQ